MCNCSPQAQSLETQKSIKSQFKRLHLILYDEELKRIAAVKKEEDEKIAGMKDKVKELSADMISLTDTISLIEEQLKEEDMVLLKV